MKRKHSEFIKKSKKNTKQLNDEQVAKKLLGYVSEMEKYGVTLNALVGTRDKNGAPFVITDNEDPDKMLGYIALILARIKEMSGLEDDTFFDNLRKAVEVLEKLNQSEHVEKFMFTEEGENKHE